MSWLSQGWVECLCCVLQRSEEAHVRAGKEFKLERKKVCQQRGKQKLWACGGHASLKKVTEEEELVA